MPEVREQAPRAPALGVQRGKIRKRLFIFQRRVGFRRLLLYAQFVWL